MQRKHNNAKQQSSSSVLSYLDLFAQPVGIWFDGKEKVYSVIGFLFTIGIFCLLGATVKSSGTQLLYREKPTVSSDNVSSEMYLLNYPKDDIDFISSNKFSNLSPIIMLDLPNSLSIDNIDSIFKIETYNTYSPLSSVNYTKCKPTQIKQYKEYFETNNLLLEKQKELSDLLSSPNLICLSDQNLIISPFKKENQELSIIFKPCVESCIDIDKQKDIINNIHLSVIYFDYIIDSSNFEDPYYLTFKKYRQRLSYELEKRLSLQTKFTQIESDTGFIMKYHINKYNFNIFNVDEHIIGYNNSTYLTIIHKYSQNIQKISRSYMKAQELAALLGGILKVYCIIAGTICDFFSFHIHKLNMINLLFKYSETERLNHSNGKKKMKSSKKGMPKVEINEGNSNIHINKEMKLNNSSAFKAAAVNNYVKKQKEDDQILDDYETQKDNILKKLSIVTSGKLAKIHLMKTDFKISHLKFIIMSFLPFCKDVKKEKDNYEYLSSILKERLDMTEVYQQMINFKRFKYYFCTPEQSMLLNLDNKLSFEPEVKYENRSYEELAHAMNDSITSCIEAGGKFNISLCKFYIKKIFSDNEKNNNSEARV